MILQAPSSRKLRRENLRPTFAVIYPSKPQQTRFPPSTSLLFPYFNLRTFLKPPNCSSKSEFSLSKSHQIVNKAQKSNTQMLIFSAKPVGVYLGFKLDCHKSRTGAFAHKGRANYDRKKKGYGGIFPVDFPQKGRVNDRKKKGYGGILPSVLKQLESGKDVEKILVSYYGKLTPKEQTVILKEQRSWQKAVCVFEWIKSHKDYLPNVIHYNVVLRALGRAQKWDELKKVWIDMVKKGVMPTNNTYGMLVDVYGKAGLVKEAILWIKHMKKLGGIFPDEVTMATVVRVLKDAGKFEGADKFYKDWLVGRIELDGLELDSVADSESSSVSLKKSMLSEPYMTGERSFGSLLVAPEDMESSSRKPRLATTYNTLIDLYGKAGRLEVATKVFTEMLKSGVAADTFTFNTMIFTCGSHGLWSEAESLLRKMGDWGVYPDTKTFNIFMSLYADAGNLDASYECFRKIREVGLSPDVVTYRAFLNVLCEKKMVQEAETVMEEMEKSGTRIDNMSLPTIISMYVNEGLIDRAKYIFEKCQLNGSFSSKTFAAIIDVYADKGLWAEAESVFLCKRNIGGQRKESVEYNVMIKAYGKAQLYEKAFMLFKGMKNHGNRPDECTYNSLVQMFSGGDLVDRGRELLTEMQEAGFKPDCLTFSALIASYVRLGRLYEAVNVYQEMEKAAVKPNEVVFGSLINGFAKFDRYKEALYYFNIMEELGMSANQVVLTYLIKAASKAGIVEGAKQAYKRMMALESGPNAVALNYLLYLYADRGMVSEAKLVFDILRKKGWANRKTFAIMMNVFRKMGMLDEAHVLEEEEEEEEEMKYLN